MDFLSRRRFLRTSTILAAGACGLASGEGSTPRPHISFPTVPRERLSVTSWPFRAYMESPQNRDRDPKKPGIAMTEFAAMVVNRFDVHNINPCSWHFASTQPSYIAKFRQSVERARSHVVDLSAGGGGFYDPDAQKRKEAVDYGIKWIDIAVEIGSPSIRPQIDEPQHLTPNVDRAAQTFGALADYGARKNIVINLENDDPTTEDPFFIAKVIDKTGNPYLRALPDFGNSAVKGPAFNTQALTVMFQHAYSMSHMKDEAQNDRDQVFHVNVPQAFAIAKAAGYRGYFSMEYDMDYGDPFSATRRLVEETLKYLG